MRGSLLAIHDLESGQFLVGFDHRVLEVPSSRGAGGRLPVVGNHPGAPLRQRAPHQARTEFRKLRELLQGGIERLFREGSVDFQTLKLTRFPLPGRCPYSIFELNHRVLGVRLYALVVFVVTFLTPPSPVP